MAKKWKLTRPDVDARLLVRGFVMIGELTGTRNKHTFECKSGHTWSATLGSVLDFCGCPYCSGMALHTVDSLNSVLVERGITVGSDFINMKTKCTFNCKEGHAWAAPPNRVLQKQLICPECKSKLPKPRRKLTTHIVNERLSQRGLKLDGEVPSADFSKFNFKCNQGHRFSATPNNVFSGRGCPDCAHYGFKVSKPAYFYVIKAKSISGSFIGYGVSNSIKSRISRHRTNLNAYGYVIESFEKFECSGYTALKLEKLIKYTFRPFASDVSGFKTEAVEYNNYETLVNLVNGYLELCDE